MRIYIQLLRQCETFRKALHKDGWMLESGSDDCFLARHPQVNDEPAARSRLHRLGLLTSPSLRIEFPRHRPGRPMLAVDL
jgi:hypothetical protein